MRTAFVALAGLVASASVMACNITTNPDGSITIKPPTEFVSDQRPQKEAAYTGQVIEVLNDGPNPALGVTFTVTGAAGATKVTAAAVVSSQGEAGDTENAGLANKEVLESFSVSEVGGKLVVRCGHATKDYGTIKKASTGCKSLVVTVPAGDATKPINLVVKSGNGGVNVAGVTGSVTVESTGSGDAIVSATPVKDSVLSVVSDDTASLAVPASFAADLVTLSADEAKDVVTTDFPDLKSGQGYGTAGTGAKSITVRSTGLIGQAILKKQ
ncbi:MAG: hypothetical protein U0183_02680 [Polyangiaceae bacterium]